MSPTPTSSIADEPLGKAYGSWRWGITQAAPLPPSRTVDTSSAFAGEFLSHGEMVTHSHGPEGEHDHANIDFNVWLDPQFAILQAEAVRDALLDLLPDHIQDIRSRFAGLSADLSSLHRDLESISLKINGRPLLASHPVYNYLSRRYHWNLKSVHWEPGELPPEQEWSSLAERLKEHPAKWMLWEDEPLPAIREQLTKLGIRPIVFLTAGNRPGSDDYLQAMHANIARIEDAVQVDTTEY